MRRVLAALAGAVLLASCSADPAPQPGTTAPPSPGAPSSSATAPPGTFTVVAAGDVLIHPDLTEDAEKAGDGKRDFGPLYAGAKPVIEAADLAICHLEIPVAGPDGPFKGYPRFSAPPEILTTLHDVGYDTCSTASNHTLDQGPTGVTSSLDALDAAGIKHTGSARSKKEADTPLILDVAGVKVAQLSFTFGLNSGTSRPAGKEWMTNVIDAADVLTAARAAREAGADVVIASLHWGIEDQHEPTKSQRELAKKLLNDPAVDLIVGHHAHVVQPFEQINGKWVAYGLGNQVARHEQPRGTTEEGVLARFRFAKGADGWTVDRAEYLPTLIELGPPARLLDLTTDTTGDAARREQALTRTDQVVLSLGAKDDGLTRPGS